MNSLFDKMCRLMDGLAACMLAAIVLLVFGNVLLRYGFNSGFTLSEELSRWIFVWMVFMGAGVALGEGKHLGTDLVTSRLPRFARQVCFAIGHVLMLYVCWLMLLGSWAQAVVNLDVTAPASGLPVAYFYASGVFFSVFAALILLRQLALLLTGQLSDGQLHDVRESEDL